jgi:hypothetical protein
LRVPEYFLFDPTQDYLEPSLQGHRLVGEQYELLVPDAQGALVSEQLGLRLQAEGSHPFSSPTFVCSRDCWLRRRRSAGLFMARRPQ